VGRFSFWSVFGGFGRFDSVCGENIDYFVCFEFRFGLIVGGCSS